MNVRENQPEPREHDPSTTSAPSVSGDGVAKWVILLMGSDAVTDDGTPDFAERGTIPLAVNGARLDPEVLVAHLRNSGPSVTWVAVGILRGVAVKPDGNVGFERFDPLSSPVDLGPPESMPTVDQQIALAQWSAATINSAVESAGKQWSSASRAREFAQYLAWAFTGTALLRRGAARALREQAPAHHLFHRQVKFWLAEFLSDHAQDARSFQINTDGLLKEGTARSRYTLLGSYVQPATSIVSPFRCAVDYTIQTDPTSGIEIRQGLLESLTHVASSSYDAAVRVVVLRSDTPYEIHSHLSLRHIHTRNFLEQLKQSGVFMALLGPRNDEETEEIPR